MELGPVSRPIIVTLNGVALSDIVPTVTNRFRKVVLPLRAIWHNRSMMFSLGPENWTRLLVWLVLGLLIYFGYSRHHSVLRSIPLATGQDS